MGTVLVGCEFSGVVRDAFREAGHEAWSCDLHGVEPEGRWPNYHLYGDVRWFLDSTLYQWDLFIAFPPCTFLCNSGVRWLYGGRGSTIDRTRWQQMTEGAKFFKELLQAPVPRIAVENPIMHKHAASLVGENKAQIIQPWQFGHGVSKATCLWLRNLPPLTPTEVVWQRVPECHHMPPSRNRSKDRSRTYEGIAKAMAQQWGPLVG